MPLPRPLRSPLSCVLLALPFLLGSAFAEQPHPTPAQTTAAAAQGIAQDPAQTTVQHKFPHPSPVPPADPPRPLPDIPTLMHQVEAAQRASEAIQKDYLYHSVQTLQEI